MEDLALYNESFESLGDLDNNGANEEARVWIRQCRSLEAELVSSRAKIARLEAECSGLKVTSDQVIKNFSVIKYASRTLIIQLKKEIRAHLKRSGNTNPACGRDHSKCPSVPILNPCHPLEYKDVLEYFDAVTSFCDCSSSNETQEKSATIRPPSSRVSPNSANTPPRICHENASRVALQKPRRHARSLSSTSSSSSTGSSSSSGSSYSSSAASGPSNQPSRHAIIPRTSRETEPVKEKPSTRPPLSRSRKEGNGKLRGDAYWIGGQSTLKRYDSSPKDGHRKESYERPHRLSPENHHAAAVRSRLPKDSTESMSRRHTKQSEKSRSAHADEDSRKPRDGHSVGAVKVSHKQTPRKYDTGVYQQNPQVSHPSRIESRGNQGTSSYSPPPDHTVRLNRVTGHPVSESRAYPRTQTKNQSRPDKTGASEGDHITTKDLGGSIRTSPHLPKSTTQLSDGTSIAMPVNPPSTTGAEEQRCLQRLSSSGKPDANASDGRPKSATLFTKRQIAKQQPTPKTPPTPTPSLSEPPPPQPPEASSNEKLEQPRQVTHQLPVQEMVTRAEDEVTPIGTTTKTTMETRRADEEDREHQNQQEKVPSETATDPSQFIYEDIINDFDAEEEKERGDEAIGSKAISCVGDAGEGDGVHQLDVDFDISLTEPVPRPSGRPRTPDEPGGDEEAHFEELGRSGDEEEEPASSDDQASGALNSPADVVVGEVVEEDAGAAAATEDRGSATRSGNSGPVKDRSYSPGFDQAESPRIDVEEVTPEDVEDKLGEELEDGEELTDGEADLEDEEEGEAAESDEEGDRGRPAKRPRRGSRERSATSRRGTSSRKHTDSFDYSDSSDGGAGADDSAKNGLRSRSRPRNSITPHTRQFRHSERERRYSGGGNGPRERSSSDLRPPRDSHMQTHSSRARDTSPSARRRKHSEFRGSSDTLLSAPPPIRRAAASPARYAQTSSVNRRYRPTANSHSSGSNNVQRQFPRPSERNSAHADHDKRSLPLRASVAYRKPPTASGRPRETTTGNRYTSQSTRDPSLSHRRILLNNRLSLMDRKAVRRSSTLKNSHSSARTGSRFVRR